MKSFGKRTGLNRGRTLLLAMTAMLASGGAPFALAGDPPAGLTRDQGDAILQELKAIRQVLEKIEKQEPQRAAARRGPAPEVTVLTKDRPTMGSADAPVTVVEFTDFQCPFCRRFIENTFPKLQDDYIKTGKVRWIQRDLPLGFHKNARKAAQAAHCAGEQGKYWEMRAALFRNSKELGTDRLPGYAASVGVEAEPFQACLDSDKYLAQIDGDVRDANAMRITGTPTFVVGKMTGDKLTGRTVVGAQPLSVFVSAITQALDKATPEQEAK